LIVFAELNKKIQERKLKGTERSLSSFEGMIDFMSNDFLGLAQNDDPVSGRSASTGSRLMTGNSKLLERTESEIASFFNSECGLLFNSGYLANLALFSCIPDRNSLVYYDKEIHASVRDGLKMSDCKSIGFKHNDPEDLKRLIKKERDSDKNKLILVAVEALYSMSGEIAPLESIIEVCEEFRAYLIVDEAHSAGVYGSQGRGLVDELNLSTRVAIRLITFGKAYGAHGAIVLSNHVLRHYLINFGRPLIYTTSISEKEALRILSALQKAGDSALREALANNIFLFRSLIQEETVSDRNSPIQVLRGPVKELKVKARALSENNIAAKLILEPTVPKEKECIRLVIHSFNSEQEIKKMLSILEK